MTEPITHAPIARSEMGVLAYPIPWRCHCGVSFGVYDLAALPGDPQRATVEAAASEHRKTHKKEGRA